MSDAEDKTLLLICDNTDYTEPSNPTLDEDSSNAEEYCPAKLSTRPDAEVWSHLQNPSTDVSAAGLTFHPKLGMVICLTVRNSIPATKNKPNELNASEPYFAWSGGEAGSEGSSFGGWCLLTCWCTLLLGPYCRSDIWNNSHATVSPGQGETGPAWSPLHTQHSLKKWSTWETTNEIKEGKQSKEFRNIIYKYSFLLTHQPSWSIEVQILQSFVVINVWMKAKSKCH